MHPTRRQTLWLLPAWAAAATHAGAQPQAPGTWTLQALREDLQQLRTRFLQVDRAYAPAARAEAERRVAALEASDDLPSLARFRLEVARIAALADNGHTLADLMGVLRQSNRVPLRMGVFGTDFLVLRTREADTRLLGARLQSIDGQPVERLRAAAHQLVGGPAAWRDRSAPFLFESPELLHALGLATQPEAADYGFVDAAGASLHWRGVAGPPSPTRPQAAVGRLLLPEVTPEDGGWRGPLPLQRAPWALREATRPFRWRHDAERALLVLQLRRATDSGNEKLRDVLAAVQAQVATLQPRHLVLDLRDNGGGDLTRGRDGVEALVGQVAGQVFVLTSPGTFSAAISLAGYARQAAPDRVRFVGEAPGDRLVFFAEGRGFSLPHSGVGLLPATERHDYRDGCRAYDDCHAPVRLRPIRVASLEPDLPAPWTFEAWRAGVDPAMQAVERALGP